jgi:hypothetical protein
VTSIGGDAATVAKLTALGLDVGDFAFGAFHWDCAAEDLEPGDPQRGDYVGDDEEWMIELGFQSPPSASVDLDAAFSPFEVQVGNDLPAGLGGPFDGGGDGYAFLGSTPYDVFLLPPWLQWVEVELLLLDPTGAALTSDSLPVGPPELSTFPMHGLVLRGFDEDEGAAFEIGVAVNVLHVPEPALSLLLAAGLAATALRRGPRS